MIKVINIALNREPEVVIICGKTRNIVGKNNFFTLAYFIKHYNL